MKYSLKQIKKYVPDLSGKSLHEITEKMWSIVSEIEGVENLEKQFEDVILARVESVEEHPSSEKLVVVSIDVGKESPITVVTAAKNMKKGDWVPYIPVGSTVPAFSDKDGNPIEIGERDMAGITSYGMLASEKEMGVSDDHTGIMIIYENEVRHDPIAGAAIAPYIEADDVVFEIENKSLTNRGDLFSAAGLAREMANIFDLEYVEPEWQKPSFANSELMGTVFDKEFSVSLKIEVSAKDEVERYSAVVLDGITVGKTPLWLKMFLQKHGVQSVNNVVDITNYVMLDYGQPMHAFDAAHLSHSKRDKKLRYTIKVRNAKSGEKLETLDGKERVLPDTAVVIADKNDAVAVAGIIGGEVSGIKSDTTRIVLESAVFDKYSVRTTSMKLGINTDASAVFSRKQDPEKAGRALLRAVHLLQEMSGAIVASPVSDEYVQQPKQKTIILGHEKAEKFIGISISPVLIKNKLEGLGFKVEKKRGMYRIQVPTWRPDVTIDEDIYEEIARNIGYDNISPELPRRGIFGVSFDKDEQVKQNTISTLVGLGMIQTMNFSFVSQAIYERLGISTEDLRGVVNAISPDVQYVRKQVLPELFSQSVKNQYNRDTFALFELGKVSRKSDSYNSITNVPAHLPDAKFTVDELGLPIEDEHLAFAVVTSEKQPAYFTAKHYLEEYLNRVGIDNYKVVHLDDLSKKVQKDIPVWILELQQMLRSGHSALIMVNDIFVGVIGEPNTLAKKEFGITKQFGLVEVSLSAIKGSINMDPVYVEPSKYPSITEDYCFAFKEFQNYSDLINVYRKALNDYESIVKYSLAPIDIYQKDKIIQYTHRVQFESKLDTDLNPAKVKEIRDSIVASFKEISGKLV